MTLQKSALAQTEGGKSQMKPTQYHVIGKKDGEEVITKFHLSRYEDAVTVKEQWENSDVMVFENDHYAHVKLDEIEIMPVELIWRRG